MGPFSRLLLAPGALGFASKRLKALTLSKCFPPCAAASSVPVSADPSPTKPVVKRILSHGTFSCCSSLGISCSPGARQMVLDGNRLFFGFFLISLHPPLNSETDVVALSSPPRPLVPGWGSITSGGVWTSGHDLGGCPLGVIHINCFAQQHVRSFPLLKLTVGNFCWLTVPVVEQLLRFFSYEGRNTFSYVRKPVWLRKCFPCVFGLRRPLLPSPPFPLSLQLEAFLALEQNFCVCIWSRSVLVFLPTFVWKPHSLSV